MPRFTGFARTYDIRQPSTYARIAPYTFLHACHPHIYTYGSSLSYIHTHTHTHTPFRASAVRDRTQQCPIRPDDTTAERRERLRLAEKKNSNFASVVRFFNAIRLYTWIQRETRSQDQLYRQEKFYNSCKVAFSVECSQ